MLVHQAKIRVNLVYCPYVFPIKKLFKLPLCPQSLPAWCIAVYVPLVRYGNTSIQAVCIIACSYRLYQVVDARAGPGGGCKTSTGLRQRSIRQRDDPDLKCKKIIKKRVSPPTVSSFPPVTPEDGKIQHNVVCLNLNMNMHWKKVFQILTTNFLKLVDHFVSAETFLRCIPQ